MATPKLSVNIKGPTEAATELAMLDTGAEANVMTYELAKKLGCPILSTENLKLKTVSGQILQFAGMAKTAGSSPCVGHQCQGDKRRV